MISRNYPIFCLFSFFLSSLAFGEESKEAPSFDREDLVGHYIGSNDDLTVSIELNPYIFKHFNFTDFVTVETFDEGDMGYWEIDGSLLELVYAHPDIPSKQLKIQEDGTLLYGPGELLLKPVGPNFLGMLFQFNRTLKDSSKAAHYRSDGVIPIQEDFTGGVEPEYSDDALHLHNLAFMYETGSEYMGGQDSGMLGMTDKIPDYEKRESLIDYKKAYEYYLKASEKGYVQSMYNLAVYHKIGRYVEKDLSKAVAWFRMAADMGHTYSEQALAKYLYEGAEGVPADEAGAVKYWRSAASKGNAAAQYKLGRLLSSDPDSTEKQKKSGENFIWISALRDYPSAYFSLFNIFHDKSNDSDEPDHDYEVFAIRFLMQACYLGDSDAHEYVEALRALKDGSEDKEDAVTPDFNNEDPVDPAPAVADSNSITLLANGGSVYITVTQKNDGVRIYRGAIEVDNPLTLDKSGPVEIMFTHGERLVIELGDERFRPSASGAAKITIE